MVIALTGTKLFGAQNAATNHGDHIVRSRFCSALQQE